jgi:bacillithiol biosynthesis cysteine-adding enzyme BshC
VTIQIISTPSIGTSLSRPAVEGSASPWYVSRPNGSREWQERGREARERLISSDWVSDLWDALEPTGAAADNLERIRSAGFAVTTGQQPGLFGGPLYTWWKALSAASLARRLEALTGEPVVPVFWAATDDSDFAEASYTVVPSAAGAERLEMNIDAPQGTSLSAVRLGDVSAQIEQLENSTGSAANPDALAAIRKSYVPDATVGGAYVKLLRELLAPLGIPVLDAAHPSVRKLGYPMMRQALERASDIEDALNARGVELKRAGHSAQVKLVKGRTLVFLESKGKRERVRVKDAPQALSTGASGDFGPNVLLRPVVEAAILPTVAYVGGPAEIAYFAQTTAVASALGARAPLIVPRWSGTVIEPRIARILDRYSLSVEDFRDPHAVETRIARDSLPASLREGIEDLREALDKTASCLAGKEGADLVSPGVLEGLKRNVNHRIERLERRIAANVKRKGNDALRDAAVARGFLFPLGTPQERALNFIPLLARNGSELIDAVMNETQKHAERLA